MARDQAARGARTILLAVALLATPALQGIGVQARRPAAGFGLAAPSPIGLAGTVGEVAAGQSTPPSPLTDALASSAWRLARASVPAPGQDPSRLGGVRIDALLLFGRRQLEGG